MNPILKTWKATVLVVSRDDHELAQAGSELTYHGYPNHLTASGTEAICLLANKTIDVLLLSTRLPDSMDFGEVIRWVRTNHPSVRIQIMGNTSLVRLKAFVDQADAIVPRDSKIVPWLVALVEHTVKAPQPFVVVRPAPRDDSASGEVPNRESSGPPVLLGRSPAMLKLKALLPTAALLKRVLVRGEAGTGKENVVQMIHWLSKRRGPLVPFNAGEFVDTLGTDTMMGHEKGAHSGAKGRQNGAFEDADGGTLFVDEIADLSLTMQVKFLRVLETGEVRRLGGRATVKVDVLFVVATNKNLKREVAEGRFRQDLYDRLSEFVVELPALRERVSDIPELAQHFADQQCRELGWEPRPIELAGIRMLRDAEYPGNLRSLRSVIHRAVVISGKSAQVMGVDQVRDAFDNAEGRRSQVRPRIAEPLRVREDRARVEAIQDALHEAGQQVSAAADILEVSRSKLTREMKRLGLGGAEGEAEVGASGEESSA